MPSTERDQALRTLASKQAIANTLATHSRGVDRADFNLLSSAYHADATVDYGFFVGPATQLASILADAQKTAPVTLHRTSNMWIAVDGPRARSESYILAYLESPGAEGATQRWIGGRYLDTHEDRAGEWRLTHRAYIMDWNINRPSSSNWPDPPVALTDFCPRGGHAAADAGTTLLALAKLQFSRKGAEMTNKVSDVEIDVMLSKQALHELGMGYARAADRGDAQLMASLFHEDSTVLAGIANGSGADFAKGVTAFVTGNLERCFHSVANEWFDVKGDDAIGESYVIAMMVVGGNDIMTGGRYVDAYRRVKGVWKFKSRSFVRDWTSTAPTTFEGGGMYGALKTRGCYGPKDPVYAFWNKK
jgi:SnoaL-like domain